MGSSASIPLELHILVDLRLRLAGELTIFQTRRVAR
jgi:hypothetical protein